MNHEIDKNVAQAASSALDQLAAATDADTAQQLDRARRQALDAGGSYRLGRRWAVGAAACAVALAAVAAVLIQVGPGVLDENALVAQELVADPELYEELEFYSWLSQEIEAE